MKAKLTGKINSLTKTQDNVSISAIFKGVVIDAPINAKEIILSATLSLKPLIADQLKIGSTITLTLSDEELTEEK